MIQWRKLIGAHWKVLRYSETSSPLENKKLRIKVADLSIDQKMPAMILRRVESTKLVVGVLQKKATTAMTPRKPKSMMVNSEVPTV